MMRDFMNKLFSYKRLMRLTKDGYSLAILTYRYSPITPAQAVFAQHSITCTGGVFWKRATHYIAFFTIKSKVYLGKRNIMHS